MGLVAKWNVLGGKAKKKTFFMTMSMKIYSLTE